VIVAPHRPCNEEIASQLEEVAELLHAQDADRYRVRAFRDAAHTLRSLREPAVDVLDREGRAGLIAIPTIGRSIAAAIEEMAWRGRWSMLDRLRGEVTPEEVLMTLPGMGEVLAQRVHDALGVETLEELEVAAHDGRLEQVEGFGPRRARAIRDMLASQLSRSTRRRARRLWPPRSEPPEGHARASTVHRPGPHADGDDRAPGTTSEPAAPSDARRPRGPAGRTAEPLGSASGPPAAAAGEPEAGSYRAAEAHPPPVGSPEAPRAGGRQAAKPEAGSSRAAGAHPPPVGSPEAPRAGGRQAAAEAPRTRRESVPAPGQAPPTREPEAGGSSRAEAPPARSAPDQAAAEPPWRAPTPAVDGHAVPPVGLLLEVDRRYREKAAAGELPTIAPRRFNPEGERWLPIWHVTEAGFHFTVLFSNSATAHRLGKTRDWVVIYWERDGHEDQATVVTEYRGPLKGRRVVRGRERESLSYWARDTERRLWEERWARTA
jgi:hypothetical protein